MAGFRYAPRRTREGLVSTRSIILGSDRAQALARYPHARVAGPYVFVSGVSSRRSDNTHEGVTIHPDGRVERDIRAQTRAVIENIGHILGAGGLTLEHIVDLTVFLVDMQDYAGMNEVYNKYFTQEHGPARTTVAVHELPHPNLLVEIKAVAYAPPENGHGA
jgi:2-aminomuconate deaminase